jgi:hypothetical protein
VWIGHTVWFQVLSGSHNSPRECEPGERRRSVKERAPSAPGVLSLSSGGEIRCRTEEFNEW